MKLIKITEAFRDVEDKIKENGAIGDDVSHNVEPYERDAIKEYTNDSRSHNDLLHRRHHRTKGGALDEKVYHEINILQKTIHRQKPLDEIHVFSGVHVDIDALYHLHDLKPFSKIEFFVPSFTSTTTALESVDGYAKLFHVDEATSAVRNLILSHGPDIKSYRNVLCFNLHGKQALKIDSGNGGVFGDSEKEFILPHSATIQISGQPTIKKMASDDLALVIWDAELVHTEDKHISMNDDSDLQNIDVNKFKKLVFSLLDIQGVRVDNQLEYRVVRGVGRIVKMFADKTERLENTGREMSYFESNFINLLFVLEDAGVLPKYKHVVLDVFSIINATPKSLLATPLTDTRSKIQVSKLLHSIFNHG